MTDKPQVIIAQYGTKHAHAHGHARDLGDNPDVDFRGVFEPDPIQRQALQGHGHYSGVEWYESADQMLEGEGIRAIAIEGAVSENLAFARQAVEAGKHIWLDKPAGADMEEFEAILKRARRARLLVQVGYMFRYNGGFQQIERWVVDGTLGEIFSVRGRMSSGLPEASRQRLAEYPGGMMFELLCHLIDVVVSLLGRPDRVHSFLRNDLGTTPGFFDNTLAVFEYESALATLESAAMEVTPGSVRRFEVYGTRGSAVLMPLEPPQLRLCLDEARSGYEAGWQDVPVKQTGRYIDDVIAFVADIRGEKTPDRSLEHELVVQETVLRASDSQMR